MKPWQQQTYYELLEVSPYATAQEIKEAYERQSAAYAPDSVAIYTLTDPAQAEDLRKRIFEAYEYLSEPDLRVDYDKSIGLPPAPAKAAVARVSAETERIEVPGNVVGNEAAPAKPVAAPEPIAAESAKQVAAPELIATESSKPVAASEPKVGERQEIPAPSEPARAEPVAPSIAAPEAAAAQPFAAGPAPVKRTEVAAEPAPSTLAAKEVAAANVEATPAPSNANVETREVAATPAPVKEEEPAQLSMQDILKGAEAVQATMPNVSVSYIPQMPRPERKPEVLSVPAPNFTPGETTKAGDASAPVQTPSASRDRRTVSAETAQESKPEATPAAEAKRPAEPAPRSEERPAPVAPPVTELSDTQKTPVFEAADTQENPVVPSPSRPSGSAPAVSAADAERQRRRKTPQPLQVAQEIAQESAIANAEAALAQVAARVREPRPRPFDVPPDAEFNGELLRKVRQAKSLSVQQVAERTKISARHLENIEADRYDALPATVYLRGILMNIAREYSLDPLRVSKSYLALVPQKK